MDEVKKSPLAPAHYPARRSSIGKRQEPKAAEKTKDGHEPAGNAIGHPKASKPADDATAAQEPGAKR